MGLLGDFAVGAAQAGEKIGLAQIQADIEENKRMRLAEFQDQLNIKSDARQEEAVVRRENRGLLAATETRKQVNEETLTQRQKQFDQDNSASNVQTSIGTATSKARAAGDIGREEETKNLTNKSSKENLRAAGQIAAATREPDRGAGLRNIQIQTAQLGLEEKRKVNALIAEAETTKDPARKAEIVQALTVRGIIKPGEFDTVSTTEKKFDGDTETSTTTTSKRRAGQADASPAAKPGAAKKGDEQVVQAGKYKGQTVVFDGTGWSVKK